MLKRWGSIYNCDRAKYDLKREGLNLKMRYVWLMISLCLVGTASSAEYGGYTAWQVDEFHRSIQKCFSQQAVNVQDKVKLRATIAANGMIDGEPEVVDPVDSDEFRADVEVALKQLRSCQPFIVDPFGRVRHSIKQEFRFTHEKDQTSYAAISTSINAALKANFQKCWTPLRRGPAIVVRFDYRQDGTYGRPPMLENPERTERYARAATELLGQINKCPPLKLPELAAKQLAAHSFNWTFPSYESARANKRGL